MRTKALIMSAAALAVGIATSNAQVYSQNIVGYVSVPQSQGVLTLNGNPLDYDGTGTNNTVATIFTSPHTNDTIYAFNGSSYDVIQYKVVQSGRSPTQTYATNWYIGSTVSTGYSLNPGRGFFYSAGANETNVIVGQVLQGTNLVNTAFPPAGTYNLLSSVAPEAGGITATLDYNPSTNDTLLVYSGGSYNTYQYKVVQSGRSPTQTYATNWFLGSVLNQPSISVGQGFWFNPGQNTNWTENFVVNP